MALALLEIGFVEVNENLPLAIPAAVNVGIGDVAAEGWIGDRTWRTYRRTEVGTEQILIDTLRGAEVKQLVLDDVAAGAAAELLAVEVR